MQSAKIQKDSKNPTESKQVKRKQQIYKWRFQ